MFICINNENYEFTQPEIKYLTTRLIRKVAKQDRPILFKLVTNTSINFIEVSIIKNYFNGYEFNNLSDYDNQICKSIVAKLNDIINIEKESL